MSALRSSTMRRLATWKRPAGPTKASAERACCSASARPSSRTAVGGGAAAASAWPASDTTASAGPGGSTGGLFGEASVFMGRVEGQ
jgi:phage tail tape-measure protein